MQKLIVGAAVFAVLTLPAVGQAQGESNEAAHEAEVLAGCAVLLRMHNDLAEEFNREGRWLDQNRNRSGVSDREFSRRVNEANGMRTIVKRLESEHDAQCKGNEYPRSAVIEVCSKRQARLSKYLYDSPECTLQRLRYGVR